MPQSSWLKPDEFKEIIQKSSKTPYISRDTQDALKKSGARRFMHKSATRNQAIKAIEELQDEGVLRGERTAKQLYEDVLKQRTAQKPVSKVNLATMHLPPKLVGRNFIQHMESISKPETFSKLKSMMREQGLTGRNILTKEHMVRLLRKLKEEGAVLTNEIGRVIKEKEVRRVANVKGLIAQELQEEETRFKYKKEDLPEFVARSAIKPAATSISRVGKNAAISSRITSVSRMNREQDEDDEEKHLSSASALKRRSQKKGGDKAGEKARILKDLFLE